MVACLMHNQWLSFSGMAGDVDLQKIYATATSPLPSCWLSCFVNYLWLFSTELMVGIFLRGGRGFVPLNRRGIDPFLVAFVYCMPSILFKN